MIRRVALAVAALAATTTTLAAQSVRRVGRSAAWRPSAHDTPVVVERQETQSKSGIANRSSSCNLVAAMKISTLFVVAVLGCVLATSCGGTPLSDGTGGSGGGGSGGSGGGGSGGGGGTVDASCEHLEYASAGCAASPICTNGSGGACGGTACGCDGKVIFGCGLFSEPFAYTIPLSSFDGADPSGMTCDPAAGAAP